MKKILALAFGAAMSFGAYAAPASQLPPGPVYLKFSGQEQIAVNGATTFAGSKEINWGVFVVSTMERGTVNTPNDAIDPNGDIFYVNGQGGQVTGMFYGIEAGEASDKNPFPGTKGYMDLYWRDLSTMSQSKIDNSINPGVRCGWSCANGFTDGTFLARLFFDTGMDLNSDSNTIVGDTIPVPGFQKGFADSYASVDKSAGGLWANQLDSNYFSNYLGDRDLRFKNSYNYNANWGNGSNNIIGARIDDPGQAYALPEPGALSLMGLAMVGMGVSLRRRQKKN